MSAATQALELEGEEHRPVFRKAFLEVRWPLCPSTRARHKPSRDSSERMVFPGVIGILPVMTERFYSALWDMALEELGMRTRLLRASDGRRGLVALLQALARVASVDAAGQLAREYIKYQFLEVVYECPTGGLGIYRLVYDPETSKKILLPKPSDSFGGAPLWRVYTALDRLSRASMHESDAWLKRTEKSLDVREASSREGRRLIAPLNELRANKSYHGMFQVRISGSDRWLEAALSALQRVGLVVFEGPASAVTNILRFTDCEEPAAEAIVLRLEEKSSKSGPKPAAASEEATSEEPFNLAAGASKDDDETDEEGEEGDELSDPSSMRASRGPLLDEDTSGEWLDPHTLRIRAHPPVKWRSRPELVSRMQLYQRATVVGHVPEEPVMEADEFDLGLEDPGEAADEVPVPACPPKPHKLSAAQRKALVAKLLAKQAERVGPKAATLVTESSYEVLPVVVSAEMVPSAVVETVSAELEKLPTKGAIESLTTALRGVVRAFADFPQRQA